MTDEEKKAWGKITAERWKNTPEERKLEIRKKMSDAYQNKSDEEKAKFREKLHLAHESKSEEEKEAIREQKREFYRNLPEEEKLRRAKEHSDWYQNTPEEYKRSYSQSKKDWWKNLPEEKKNKYRYENIEWWYRLPLEVRQQMNDAQRERYNNLPAEVKELWSQRTKEQWSNMTVDQRKSFMNRVSKASRTNNDLCIRFEKTFLHSELFNSFYYVKEYKTIQNDISHKWDYALFNNNSELVMLIDLDGLLYHGCKYGYDGNRCKENLDEQRFLSVPDSVKVAIIPFYSVYKVFQKIIDVISMDYNEYIDYLSKELSLMPFPDPSYSCKNLLIAWNVLVEFNFDHVNLKGNNRLGDWIIFNFHHSIWSDKIKGKLSVRDVWKNEYDLKEAIKDHAIAISDREHTNFLQSFNVYDKSMRIPVFSAGRAKMIINRYLAEFDTIFDPFSGYSGIMLGALSVDKKYIGQDISIIHVNESNNLLEFIREYCVAGKDSSVICKDIYTTTGSYQCLFTCPPYQDEVYQDVPLSTNTCDDWIDVYLERFKCKRYVFVVDSTEKYKDNIVLTLHNFSINKNDEYVVIIDR